MPTIAPRRTHAALRAIAIVALVTLQIIWIRQPAPLLLKVLPFALAALSIWRPTAALFAFAALAPLKGEIWGLLSPDHGTYAVWSAPLGLGLLEQMALATLSGPLLRWRSSPTRLRLPGPALVVGAIAVASAVAALPGRVLAAGSDLSLLGFAARLWAGDDFRALPEWRPLFFALTTIEGLALACVTERVVRELPARAWRLIGTSIAGHIAIAGTALVELAQLNAHRPEVLRDANLLTMVRISRLTDLNATGSVFVLMVLTSGALVDRTLRGVAIIAGMLLLTAGLWLSGSRTALLSLGIVVLVAAAFRWTPRGRTVKWLAVATGLACLAAIGTLILTHPGKRSGSLGFIVPSRLIMLRVGLSMARTAPVFGVGIGTFWDRSVDFGANEVIDVGLENQFVLPDPHENAHNNFVQILAEQGIVGLIACVALLMSVLVPAVRGQTRGGPGFWLLTGILGFILTWLGGHPLLAAEAAFAFWLFFGVLAGLTPVPAAPGVPSRWMRLGAIALIISLPFRIVFGTSVADFSHAGVGLSPWTSEPVGGLEYRTAGAGFSLYVPANRLVTIPIQRVPDAPASLTIEIRQQGRLVNSFRLTGENWIEIRVAVQAKRRNFARLDCTIHADPPAPLPATVVRVRKDF